MKDSTRRTLRTAFAVLVALAAGAPVLVHEAGLKPDKWPWLATLLVVAGGITRLLASQVVEDLLARFAPWLSAGPSRPGRHELGGTAGDPAMGRDAGSARVRALLAVAFALLLVGFTAATAQAHWHRPDSWGRPTVPAPPVRYADAGGAWDCSGVLWVAFTSKAIVGGEQVIQHDDAGVTVQLFERAGRVHPASVDGAWMGLDAYGHGPAQSAGESRIRWPYLADITGSGGGSIVDKARVVRAGVASTPVVIVEGCPS